MQKRIKKFLVTNRLDLLQAGLALTILVVFASLLIDFEIVIGKKKSALKGISDVVAVLGTVALSGSLTGNVLSGGRWRD